MTTKLEERTQTAIEGTGPSTTATGAVSPSDEGFRPKSLHSYRAEAEATAISRALEMVGWNRRRAAELLRISYRGLLYKIRQYKITAATQNETKAQPGDQQLDEM